MKMVYLILRQNIRQALGLQAKTVCMTCLRVKGLQPSAGDSHGYCVKHYLQFRRELAAMIKTGQL